MATKKTAWERSEFGKIKLLNLFNALYHALMVAIPALIVFLSIGMIPNTEEIYITISTVATAFFGSLFKGMFTNENGKPFSK